MQKHTFLSTNSFRCTFNYLDIFLACSFFLFFSFYRRSICSF
uniref:Uncharacterized protein n=1 Tax=Anguilla anguilla TaxID=7936 RepID=A0A0E9U3G0_ANGAN